MSSQQTEQTHKRKRGDLNMSEKSPPTKKHRTLPNNPHIHIFIAVIHCLTNIKATRLPKARVAKDIKQQAGDVKSVYEMPGGDLKVVCHSKTQFDKLLNLDLLAEKPVSVKLFNRRKEQCKGVIYDIDLNVNINNIVPTLSKQNVVFAKRLQKDKKETTSIMLVFNGTKIPETILLWSRNMIVKPFFENPKRCFNCQKFCTHNAKYCKSKTVCPACAGPHTYEQCTETQKKCANCKMNHSSGWKGCSYYKNAKAVEYVKAERGISYAQAVRETKINLKQRQTIYPSDQTENKTSPSENPSVTNDNNSIEQTKATITMDKLDLLGFINIVINSVHSKPKACKADVIANIARDFLNWEFRSSDIIKWGFNPKYKVQTSTPVKHCESLSHSNNTLNTSI